jgi:DNA-binding beta-propeller fold protein YncE
MRSLVVLVLTLTCAASSAAGRAGFELPYDLVVARDGTIYMADRSRILRLEPKSGRVGLHRRVPGASELTALARLGDGTFLAADLPSGKVVRVPPKGAVTTVVSIPMPVDLLVDPATNAVWVASIADDVGLVRLDLATGMVEPFARVDKPHGLDRLPDGDLVVHDGHVVSRVDPTTGASTPFARVDAFELAATRSGAVYGVTGGPNGGRVVRISSTGRVTPVAGTGRLGPHRDGRALRVPMLPSAIALDRDGSLLVAQIEPVPAIRRLDLRRGTISTIALGR